MVKKRLDPCEITDFIRMMLRHHGNICALSRASGVSEGTLQGLRYRDASDVLLKNAEALVPFLLPGHKLCIWRESLPPFVASGEDGKPLSLTEILRREVRRSENFRALARDSGLSLGAIYNLKNNDDSDVSLTVAARLLPCLMRGYVLKIHEG